MHLSPQLRADDLRQRTTTGFPTGPAAKKEQKKNELKQQNEKQALLYNKHNQQLRPPKEMKPQKENTHSLCTVNKVI